MDGWNFLDTPPTERRNELRCQVQTAEQDAGAAFEEMRAIIVEVLRDFPDAYMAVIERLRRIPLTGETH
jgi:hypothetical protein